MNLERKAREANDAETFAIENNGFLRHWNGGYVAVRIRGTEYLWKTVRGTEYLWKTGKFIGSSDTGYEGS